MPTVRQPTPEYDKDALRDALLQMVTKVGLERCLDFGVYKGIPVGHAVHGRGLAQLEVLITTIVNVSPADVRDVVMEVAKQIQGLCPPEKPWPTQMPRKFHKYILYTFECFVFCFSVFCFCVAQVGEVGRGRG